MKQRYCGRGQSHNFVTPTMAIHKNSIQYVNPQLTCDNDEREQPLSFFY